MTRLLSILAACLAVAVLALGLLLARARDDAALARAKHAAEIEAKSAALAEARAAVRVATSSAAKARQAHAEALARLEGAKVDARARTVLERIRETQTLSQEPSADIAREHLAAAGVTTTETSTLALTWAAMARFRRLHAEAEVKLEVAHVEADVLRAECGAQRAVGAVNEAKLERRIAGLDVALARSQAEVDARVTRTRRAVSVVAVAAAVAGVVGGSVGLALCRSARCREVAGLGGGGLAVAGGVVAVLSW